jgi:two-component system, NtrC family, response regulator HydG
MSQLPSSLTDEVPTIPSPRSWRLRFVFGGKERFYTIERGQRVLIGTSADVDFLLNDPAVSARHCEVEATTEGLRLVDLGSKNGVYVGAGRVSTAILPGTGGAFVIGRTSVEVVSGTAERSGGDLGLIGKSFVMERVRKSIHKFARLRAPVLICGESGTGKDLVARALHAQSGRRGEYCPLNVAALPDGLLDAELFGHQRGAFTGAVSGRNGLFEVAHEGTLFLDEIAEMSPGGQAKLLRVVEDGCVRAIGSDRARQVDVRIVSATCAPLGRLIKNGKFRGDLYHRLSPLVIELPPLRQRRDDIAGLATHYLSAIAGDVGRKHLTTGAIEALKAAPWPGNVRELFGVLYRAAAVAEGDQLSPGHFEFSPGTASARSPLVVERARELMDIHGTLSAAARAAGVPRTTFRSVLERDRARRCTAE